MIASSILICSDREYIQKSKIINENLDSYKKAYPNLHHMLFNKESIEDFLKDKFGVELIDTFRKLKPFSYKTDLAKYCIIYHYGGVYSDVSIYFKSSWPPNKTENYTRNGSVKLSIFSDFHSFTPWQTASSLFCAPPRHAALLAAINMVCANVRSGYYGTSPLCPTGPVLFGKAIAFTCSPDDLLIGQSAWLVSYRLWGQTRVFPSMLPNFFEKFAGTRRHGYCFGNEIIAFSRKKGGGSLAELGVNSGNSYVDMWNKGDIYSL